MLQWNKTEHKYLEIGWYEVECELMQLLVGTSTIKKTHYITIGKVFISSTFGVFLYTVWKNYELGSREIQHVRFNQK